jgi:nitrile hydratase accessory protein
LSPSDEGPQPPSAFDAPWQARAFAITVRLNEAGHLAWPEWTQRLGAEIARAGDAPDAYWRAWLTALEGVLKERGIADADAIDARQRREAARMARDHQAQLTSRR